MDSGYSFGLLVQAYFDCRRHKRTTASALRFEQDLEHNLIALHEELTDGSYRPGRSICFAISRPRTLHAALNRLERMPDADVYASGNSYLGLVRQASHSHNAQAKVCRALLKRGHAVDGMHLEKAFRKHQ